MANLVKVDMKNMPAALSEMHIRITDLNRNEIYSGTVPAANEIYLGDIGTVGQGVLIHTDNYNGSNAGVFMSSSGYSLIEKLIEVSAISERFSEAINSDSPYTYIVTGDSTRDSVSTPSIQYYEKQLSKVNFTVFDNAESGQSASDWLNNSSNATLNDAIAATPGTGQTTILEMSLGINKEAGQVLADIKQDIVDGISSYLSAKPDALIVFVSPNKFNTSYDYDSMYLELTQMFENAVFVSGHAATVDVYDNVDFYADNTHPNASGSKRVVNYVFSNLLPENAVNLMTLENEQPPIVDPNLTATVETGLYYTSDGRLGDNESWRRLAEIHVEPNFIIKIDHGGNKFECIFLDEQKNFIKKENSTAVDGESYRLVQVPANAYYMRSQVTDEGASYDALNYNVTVVYEIDNANYLTQEQINAGLQIRMPIA